MARTRLLDRLKAENPQDLADTKVIEQTQKIWEYLKQSRRRLEFEWFINDQYYRNEQYLKYNTGARRVQTVSVEKMNDKVVINKVYQQVRGIVNFLNSEHPEVGVRPGNQADNAYMRAKQEKHLCDYWYRHLQLNKKSKKVSLDGAKYGLGWIKVLWDQDALAPTAPFTTLDNEEKTYTYGEVMVERVDPFELYFDPMAQDKGDMRYIIHAPVRTIAELKANPLYRNTDKLTPDTKLAASVIRQAQLRINVSNAQSFAFGQANGMDTVVTLEIFQKLFNPESRKWEVWVTTRTETGILLRHEKWAMDEFPFEFFQTDIAGMVSDSRGVIHNIREPNRALNEMMSQVHETARIMGKLNWLVPRGSNLNVITDETGQFLEYDVTPGGRPEQAAAINLPSYIMQHIGTLNSFLEDIGGMHAGFNGKAPFAQASGDLVDTLSEGDQNNLTMMRDNYDDFFVRMFKLMLKTAKVNYATSRKFPSSQEDEFGEVRWMEIKPTDISVSDDLDVSTGSQMPYSIAQKQQMYMNLWKEKAITDPSVLFKLLEMPDLDNAMGDDEADIERQLDEIRDILKNKKPADPEIFENHAVHISTLDKFSRGDKWYKLSDTQKQWVRDHRSKHIEFSIQLAQIQASMEVEPIKRSATLMVRPTSINELTAVERTALFEKGWGIQSDAAEIQLRGGLYIQDPAQAEIQAQNEDIEMLNERAVLVGLGDNHQVHLQTHSQAYDMVQANLKAQKQGKPVNQPVSQATFELFTQHINDHIAALKNTMSTPGLVPNGQINMPNQPNLHAPDAPEDMPKQSTDTPPMPTDPQQGKMTQIQAAQALAQAGAIPPAPQGGPQPQPQLPPNSPPVASSRNKVQNGNVKTRKPIRGTKPRRK